MDKIKDVFFDLDNTLWDFKRCSNISLKQIFQSFGLVSEFSNFLIFQHIYEHHNQNLWIRYYNNGIEKDDLVVRRFYLTLKEKGLDDIEFAEDINREYMKLCHANTIIFPDTINTLTYLKNNGYKCHAISNGFTNIQLKKINDFGLKGLLNTITCSEEIGLGKPHPEIFNLAISKANASIKYSLMVGDDYNTDIKGAINCGIKALHLSKSKKYENSISSIEELKKIL